MFDAESTPVEAFQKTKSKDLLCVQRERDMRTSATPRPVRVPVRAAPRALTSCSSSGGMAPIATMGLSRAPVPASGLGPAPRD